MSDFVMYLVVFLLIYVAYKYLFSPKPVREPIEDEPELPPTEKKDMNLEELHKYDGTDPAVKNRIYIAVRGKIHDVTRRPGFYGPNAPYHVMAGHDATYALARGTLDSTDMDLDDPPEMSPLEQSTLRDWEMTTFWKYPVVGKLLGRGYEDEDEEKKPESVTKTAKDSSNTSTDGDSDSAETGQTAFTLEELHQHDGSSESSKVYVAVKGLVFDMSKNEDFQKGGSHALCAGKDASLCLAKDSVVLENVNQSIGDVSFSDLQRLEAHLRDFQKNYKVIGHLAKGSGATSDQAEFYLSSPEPPTDPVYQAVSDNDLQKVKDLIASGEDIDSRSAITDLTPLHLSIQERHVDIAEFLVQSGASLTEKASLYEGETAKELAKRFDLKPLMEMFHKQDAVEHGGEGEASVGEQKEISDPESQNDGAENSPQAAAGGGEGDVAGPDDLVEKPVPAEDVTDQPQTSSEPTAVSEEPSPSSNPPKVRRKKSRRAM